MIRGLLIVFSVVLLLVTGMTLWLTRGSEPELGADTLSRLQPAAGKMEAIGGPFTLIDQDGKTVTEKDFDGKLKLVFFGFTHCPDICPVTLATLTSLMNHLGDKADQVVPLFITVDPERDTPARLKEYLRDFHPAIRGLTGSNTQIAQAAKEYKVYYAAAKPEQGAKADYAVDHSSMVYFMSRNDGYLGYFSPDDTEKSMLETITARLD